MLIEDFLTSRTWVLVGIAATFLAGAVAVIANFLKSLEIVRNLKDKNERSEAAKSKSAELKVDLRDVGITPFKTANHSIGNTVSGVLVAATVAEIATRLRNHAPTNSHEHGAEHGVSAHSDNWHAASDHDSAITDTHQMIADHSDILLEADHADILDWIKDTLS